MLMFVNTISGLCTSVCCHGAFLSDQLKENETNKQKMNNFNSLYLCSVLKPKNINGGSICLKIDMEVTKVKKNRLPKAPPHPSYSPAKPHQPHTQTQQVPANAR